MAILKSAHGASAWEVGKGRMMGGGGGCVCVGGTVLTRACEMYAV